MSTPALSLSFLDVADSTITILATADICRVLLYCACALTEELEQKRAMPRYILSHDAEYFETLLGALEGVFPSHHCCKLQCFHYCALKSALALSLAA
jgi:hypothetical protein